MAKTAKFTGLKKVARNIENARKTKMMLLDKGIYTAALLLQRESQKIVPIDRNFLRPSAGTKKIKFQEYQVYYTAKYAVFVHEIQAKHKPGKRWKFLEEPARTKRKEMVARVVLTIKKGKVL